MIRPNLHKASAFDSLLGNKFTFTYSGNQAVKNELIIRDNITNEVVYQEIIQSLQLFHVLSPAVLQNGESYNAQIRVYDIDNNVSDWSNTIVFVCLKTPYFNFSNLTPNQIIQSSSYDLVLDYQQENNEPLNVSRFVLYCGGAEIYNSGAKHGNNLLSNTINGLEDNTHYQIRATGETLNGLIVDTGLISFSVDYIEPSLFAIVDLENLCHAGEIRIQSNIKSIIGTSTPDLPEYDNSRVVLTQIGSWVKFDEGFSIKNDFTLQIKGNAFIDYSTILVMTNDKSKIELIYMIGTFNGYECAYFVLKANNKITNYYQTSNYIDIPDKIDELYITIHKANQTYQIIVQNKGKEV